MRRPSDLGGLNKTASAHASREEGRFSRMKRMLADSLLLGRRPAPGPLGSKLFGTRLQDAALSPEGVPVVVVRLCTFLENHGLQCEDLFSPSSGNQKVADRLRASLEKRWDALELEASRDFCSAASLLLLWLRDLAEPILWNQVATELLSTHEKMRDEEASTWRDAVSAVLCTLPDANIRLLQYLLRFLHRYCVYQQQLTVSAAGNPRPATLSQLGAVFAPLLVLKGLEPAPAAHNQTLLANQLTARLIQDQTALFHQWLIDHSLSSGRQRSSKRNTALPLRMVPPTTDGSTNQQSGGTNQQRKRKERNESSGSNQSLERKVIRSSSEERRAERTKSCTKEDNIRRVSSHEDFLSKKPESQSQTVLPLHESNHVELRRKPGLALQIKDEPLRDCQAENETAPLLDDSEHEKRRSSERFSRALIPPRALTRRNLNRKKRLTDISTRNSESDGYTSSKENDGVGEQPVHRYSKPPVSPARADLVDASEVVVADPAVVRGSLIEDQPAETTHTFLQLHTTERERSPSPSVSPCTPPLDLSTLHQNVDGSEPIASRVSWSFAHCQQQEELDRDPMLSPRNSMILPHRTFMDHNIPPSPPREHAPGVPGASRDIENQIKKLCKQATSVKKKLKRHEETFERDFGYRPSQSDKMTHKDMKRLCRELGKLRIEIKQLKEDQLAMGSFDETSVSFDISATGIVVSGTMVEAVNDLERRMRDKRRSVGRPDAVDDMTAAEQVAEKLIMQKSLLYLEKLHGRAVNKDDREKVRPLYDRYRALKRVVARASSSKLKDNVNELATIHEHEAMDFTLATSASTPGGDAQDDLGERTEITVGGLEKSDSNSATNESEMTAPGSISAQASVEEGSDSQTSSSDSLAENLHALPLSDLILQLIQTRNEKLRYKQLRRTLEDKMFKHTGRLPSKEERSVPNSEYASVYSSYKQAKAKLRLLEALVAKHRKLHRRE